MRKSRAAGLVLLATATLAQPQQTVEITSEPSHHLVLQNDYVRVFDVTVAPKASTLIHRHNYDYLFVTLGDSDLTNARVGEKTAALQLKDGDVRFTPGHFTHAAINNADRPFHNITIELLKPTTNEQPCQVNCSRDPVGSETFSNRLYLSDQWTVSLVTLGPKSHTNQQGDTAPRLLVPVSGLSLLVPDVSPDHYMPLHPGQLRWLPAGAPFVAANEEATPARFVVLEFNPEPVKPGSPTRAGVARGGVQKP